MDSYNEIEATDSEYKQIDKDAAEKYLKALTWRHTKTAEQIIKQFIIPHRKFENTGQQKKIEISMKFPPKIPPPKNNFDCKVFMLEFAKYICVGRGFNFSYKEMPLFRDQIKEELLMKQINSRINSNFESQCMLVSHPLIIHLFLNPPRKNLWFSNAFFLTFQF